jgi:hypothetical protein
MRLCYKFIFKPEFYGLSLTKFIDKKKFAKTLTLLFSVR